MSVCFGAPVKLQEMAPTRASVIKPSLVNPCVPASATTEGSQGHLVPCTKSSVSRTSRRADFTDYFVPSTERLRGTNLAAEALESLAASWRRFDGARGNGRLESVIRRTCSRAVLRELFARTQHSTGGTGSAVGYRSGSAPRKSSLEVRRTGTEAERRRLRSSWPPVRRPESTERRRRPRRPASLQRR